MAVLTQLGRFLNIEGEGSPWLQPNVIPAKARILSEIKLVAPLRGGLFL